MTRTKDTIAEAFIQLLDEKAISKITVKDIVDRCGVNRNTFYYHFQDIPALCEYIWKQKIDELIATHCQPNSPKEAVAVAVAFFTQHRNAVLHVYRSLSREVFLRYLDQLALYLVQEYIESISADSPLSPVGKQFVVRYYKCTLVGLFLDWLESNMNYDMMQIAMLICDLRSESGKQMLETLGQADITSAPLTPL